jgi:hypothetical protein
MAAGRLTLLASLACAAWAERVDFVREVRPILERSCLACHGAQSQMGNLRLDVRNVAQRVIISGDAGKSELFRRVAGIGEQARMPMGGKPLSAAQIEIIKRWIDEGAEWPESASAKAEVRKHWAYVPPVKPAVPAVRNAAWGGTPIDRFILARLEKEGLQPSPAAGRATLLRRLSLDLTGLPPAPTEIDAFLSDPSPRAYEKQVERLLASPHYGEKWARWWLDAARYADSDGFEKDKMRSVWFYRDWVIGALNRDLPYDRFITEQLAGDLLPGATQDQRVATGFLRNSMINEEGGVDPEQFRMEALFDRMDAIGKGVLGVTIQCAQCHNHKYDPLSQEEYYRLFAFLNSTHEGSEAVYTQQQQKQRAGILDKIRALENSLKERTPEWRQRVAEWAAGIGNRQPRWEIVRPEVDDISTGGQRYLAKEDGSFLAAGYAPTKHRARFTFKTNRPVRSLRLELMCDADLPLGGPGRSIFGTAALTEIEVDAAPAASPYEVEMFWIERASADFSPPETELPKLFDDRTKRRRVTGPVKFAFDGKDETAWGTDAGPGLRNQPRQAVFVLEKPIDFEGGSIVHVYLKQRHGGWNSDDNQNYNLGRFRLSASDTEAEADPRPADEAQWFSAWRQTVAEFKDVNDEIAALWAMHPEPASQLVLRQMERERPTHVLARGDFLKPGKQVEPGTPAFLNPWPVGAPNNRLGLAQWITSRAAPTTARSLVNRVWAQYFGRGLVETLEDLGQQSDTPTHPELLDWLAVEFMDSGWSLKELHRMIVTSAAYRQSSRVTADGLERDPGNRLLSRGPRFRADAETVRDIALSVSGLLNPQVGGPSVFPPAPDFLFAPPASYGPKNWPQAEDRARHRRALYTFRYRSVPYPALQNFDAPNGDMSCVRRARSNTPLQALTTLNEPLFFEAAQALGVRALEEGGATNRSRIAYAFRLCTGRAADADEISELERFLNRQRRLNPALAWTALARVLLNLDETITKE